MFTHSRTRTVREFVPYVKTEVRAPTDDSIRLYKEMIEKAHESILDTIVIKNTIMEIKSIVERDYLNEEIYVRWVVLLNGYKIQGKSLVHGEYNRENTIELIINDASNSIAVELMKTVLNDPFKRSAFK